jgi:hypothetical protein
MSTLSIVHYIHVFKPETKAVCAQCQGGVGGKVLVETPTVINQPYLDRVAPHRLADKQIVNDQLANKIAVYQTVAGLPHCSVSPFAV